MLPDPQAVEPWEAGSGAGRGPEVTSVLMTEGRQKLSLASGVLLLLLKRKMQLHKRLLRRVGDKPGEPQGSPQISRQETLTLHP